MTPSVVCQCLYCIRRRESGNWGKEHWLATVPGNNEE